MKIASRHIYQTLIVVLLAYVLVKANTPESIAPSSGNALNGQSAMETNSTRRFTVATYNIRRSKGLDNERDINRAIGVLRKSDADVIGLNELSGTLFYGLTDQAEQIGTGLDFGWLFAPAYRLFFQDYFGNGFVSRWPVSSWYIQPLTEDTGKKKTFRNMIVATVIIHGTTVNFLITHLDKSAIRVEQLKQVLEIYKSLPAPAVLLGDLNTPRYDPDIRAFLADSDVRDAIWVTQKSKDKRFDWIISRGLKIVSGGRQERGISDHPAFWVEFQVPRRYRRVKSLSSIELVDK